MKKPPRLHELLAAAPKRWDGTLVHYLNPKGKPVRALLADCAAVAFEDVQQMRAFEFHRRQRHFPGWLWCATVRRHVGYDSHLERSRLVLLDRDPDVVGIAAQPFWLHRKVHAATESHCPDYFVRLADGTGVIVDVKSEEYADDHDTVVDAEIARDACEEMGWEYRLVHEPDPVEYANANWLHGFARDGWDPLGLADAVLTAAVGPMTVACLAARAGEPGLTFPWVMHHLWHHRLGFDETGLLDHDTTVWRLS